MEGHSGGNARYHCERGAGRERAPDLWRGGTDGGADRVLQAVRGSVFRRLCGLYHRHSRRVQGI